jgi:hypothetical protein
LRKFDRCDSGRCHVGIEQIDLAEGFTLLNRSKKHLVTAAHGSGVEFTGDDKKEAALLHALLDEVLARLNWQKFTITAEDVTIFIAERFENTLGGQLRSGKRAAHGLGEGI